MYKYKAIVTKVYDGDTVTVDIDLGFNMWKIKESIRLDGIDTPELRASNEIEKQYAKMARDFLADKILGREIVIETMAKDKYGRYLANLFLDGIDINELMLTSGHARFYTGGRKEEWIF